MSQMSAPQDGGEILNERLSARFAKLRSEGRAALGVFVMAGDPDAATTAALIDGLPGAGADFIELGMPFTDPMADGPAIQEAGQRALAAGMSLRGTLDLARDFRAKDADTPLMHSQMTSAHLTPALLSLAASPLTKP